MMTMIGNRYQIEAELGAGGMGTVYRAIDTHSDQTVAVKQLKAQVAQMDLIERFRREGEALRDLNHPNIVKMLDMVEQDGIHYLVMDYVSGGDLQNLLKEGQLSIEDCLKLAIDLCDALTRAHKLDIIHRDLKPANALIAEDGTLRLSDFGVALVGEKERVTASNAIVGTIDYLPPEVFQEGILDRRIDIWAFGVMLFEMLAGKRPFSGKTTTQTIYNIVTEPVPDLEALRPDAPIALLDLVYRMLEKDPAARIRSVRRIGSILEDILEGQDDSIIINNSRFDTPIPKTLFDKKDNLPHHTTAFVGRESELAELSKMLDAPELRLITIIASGGMGKTHLSIELGRQHIANFADGVFFVDLTALSAVDEITSAIADAIGFKFMGDGRSEKQQILDFLTNKNILLIMDNFEHILDAASIVTDILNTAPNLQVISTSRQALKQTGETLFHLSGMDFPDWETPEDALQYAAIKLFMNSAVRALPSFELTTGNLDDVARICRLVQGMPLGILLAASWLSMLTPEEIATEIQQDIDILADETGQVPERQRSIRAVMDYSWQIMSEEEQASFMKMSLFVDGFSREAAQEITGANLRMLMSLSQKSLIRRDIDTGRYRIHELLRQYTLEKLQQDNHETETHIAHSTYYLHYLTHWANQFNQNNVVEAFEQIRAEYENINSALWNAIDRVDESLIDEATVGLMHISSGIPHRERHLISGLVAALKVVSEDNILLLAKLTICLAQIRLRLREFPNEEEIVSLKAAIEILVKTEEDEYFFYARRLEAAVQGRVQGMQFFLEIMREIQTLAADRFPFFVLQAEDTIAYYSSLNGDIEPLEQFCQRMIETIRSSGHKQPISEFISRLGEIYIWLGDYQTARQLLTEAIMEALGLQQVQILINSHVMLGLIEFLEGNYELAQQHLDEVHSLAERMGLPQTSLADARALHVRLDIAQGNIETATQFILQHLQNMNWENFYKNVERIKNAPNEKANFSYISVARIDWLLYRGKIEQAAELLHFVLDQHAPPSVRRCVQLLIDQLPEHYKGIDVSDFDFYAALKTIKDDLEEEIS